MSRHQTSSPTVSTQRLALRGAEFGLDYLLALPIGCVAALLWSNTLPESYYRFALALSFPINDIGIVFFFALITKEIAEATVTGRSAASMAPGGAALRRGDRQLRRGDCRLCGVSPQRR